MKKPRVLVIENGIDISGGVNSIVRSSERLKDAFDFLFIVPSSSRTTAYLRMHGFEVFELPMKEIRKNFLSLIWYFPLLLINAIRLARLTRELKIDIINNNDFYNLLPPVYKFFGGRLPYVCYVRFLPARFPSPLVKLWCIMHRRFASSIIAVSQVVKNQLPYQDKVIVVGNELPLDEDNARGQPAETTLILYPANFTKGKGQEYAIQCFAEIHKRFPEWKLRFVGGDFGLLKNKEFKKSLIKLTAELGIEGQVEWAGFTNDMASQYRQAAIVLNFSESESFSLTCLEGMYYGRAVVATDCGGPSEIIEDGITGLIVPVKDVKKMEEALEALLVDPIRRNEMAAKGYASVRVKFNSQKISDQLAEIYRSGLRNKTPNF